MQTRKRKDPELLSGVDPEQDCQPTEPNIQLPGKNPSKVNNFDYKGAWDEVMKGNLVAKERLDSWVPQRGRWAYALEKASLWVERPFAHLTGTTQLNPFYHSGTIASFLAIVVGLSGFYIFLFFQYGIDASYESVLTRIEGPFLARVGRAVHKYASGALVITTLLHAYRTLFMERFRGQRWLAWISGIVMTFIIWLAGVTGYWLIADERAQLINDGFIRFLNSFSNLGDQYVAVLTAAENSGESWQLLLLLLIVHVVLYLIVVGFFIIHVLRLKRAQFLPELHWTLGIGAILLLISALFPVGMLPKANPNQIPDIVTVDPLFLFYLPTDGNFWAYVVWGGLFVVTVIGIVLPWLPHRKKRSAATSASENGAPTIIPIDLPKVNIIKDRCTGCTKCALDCPYGAIEMVERHDGKRHKYIAIEDPSLCVSCGICVGSCDILAVTMGDTPPEIMWATVATRLAIAKAKAPEGKVKVVFTCERHAAHGAQPYLENGQVLALQQGLEIVTLPCVGAAPPDLMSRALDAGASEVQVIGCPPFDCANREGNIWAERRLVRKRVPRLRRPYANAPITAVWLPPDQFAKGLQTPPIMTVSERGNAAEPNYLVSRRMFPSLNWRNFVAAFGLLAVVMIAQIFLTDIPFTPQPSQTSQIRILLDNPAQPFNRTGAFVMPQNPVELHLEVDGQTVFVQSYSPEKLFSQTPDPFWGEFPISTGNHHVQLVYIDTQTDATTILFDNKVDFQQGQIVRFHYKPNRIIRCFEGVCCQ
ncbi:MAG: hydrogenase iron-sulfur subunit [Chloroflexi bacterium]|nr:MAG: hydrogenase iron-sulfur subunit [Chloroflexota bacterium]